MFSDCHLQSHTARHLPAGHATLGRRRILQTTAAAAGTTIAGPAPAPAPAPPPAAKGLLDQAVALPPPSDASGGAPAPMARRPVGSPCPSPLDVILASPVNFSSFLDLVQARSLSCCVLLYVGFFPAVFFQMGGSQSTEFSYLPPVAPPVALRRWTWFWPARSISAASCTWSSCEA